MESDTVGPTPGKKDPKPKAKKEAKVTIEGEEMSLEEMKDRMQSPPGEEFFKTGRDKGLKSRPAAAPEPQKRSTAVVAAGPATTEEERKEEPRNGDEGSDQAAVAEKKPSPSGLPAGLETKQANKWLKLLDAGWYPMKSKDGTKMYLNSPDSNSKSSVYPLDKAVFEWWLGHMTDVGKSAYEAKINPAENSANTVSGGTSLLAYMTTKASREVPLVRNQLGKIGFMQQVLYDLGWLTFLKVSKAPGLLPEDLWKMALNDDPLADQAQEVRELFAGSFEKALDNLLRGLNSAEEIAQLDHELGLESGRLLKSRQETAAALKMAKYYEEHLRIAVSCMPASVMQEYFNRTLVVGLVNATERAELGSAKAQIPQGGTPPA